MKLISKTGNKIIIKDCGEYILVDLGKKSNEITNDN